MSVTAIASLRPLRGPNLRHATTGLLSIQLRSRSATLQIRAVVDLVRADQRRHQSTNPPQNQLEKDSDETNRLPKKQQAKEQPVTFRKFAGRALGAGLRSLLTAISPTGIKTAFRQSPGSTSLALFVLVVLGCILAYTIKLYFTYFYHSQFTRYPKPIANALRRALYYTNIAPDTELALKYYKRAMELCAEHGLDPFSNEVLGIRIQTSFWLQKIGNYKGTIHVLESVLGDCRRWLDVMEQSVKDGKVDNAGRLVTVETEAAKVKKEPEATANKDDEETEPEEEHIPENLWHKRRRILAKAIGTAVKLGELYADEHVLDPDNSQKHLIWAVENALKEFRRRKSEGVKDDEGDWLSPEEMGATMEALSSDYERRSQHHLAIPLFFQALRLCDSPCHRVTIMNNLAVTFAQHPIFTPTLATQPSEELRELNNPAMPATRKECLEAALNWARNAYAHAKDVQGDDRTDECDTACAVSLCNWADIAALMGNKDLARKKYNRAIEMGNKLGFDDAIKQAQTGLAKLEAPAKGA